MGSVDLYPLVDVFECPNYHCKDCRHFRFVMPGVSPSGCTHRFDHNKMDYARPYFDNVPEEMGIPCCDFEPDGSYPAAMSYWHGYEHWRKWRELQERELDYEVKISPHYKSDEERLIGFRLKQAPKEFYYVRLSDYINGTMWDGNRLKAVERYYYKTCKRGDVHPVGIELVRERINGVEVK